MAQTAFLCKAVMTGLKILVVEDHPMFREAIKEKLHNADFISEVHEAVNGVECLKALEASKYDLVIMDINMPVMDGIECTTQIQQHYPELRVIILTQYDSPGFYRKFDSLGISGYVLKSANVDVLLSAVKSAFENLERYVSRGVQRSFQNIGGNASVSFSTREFRILELICSGKKSNEIAEETSLSIHTVNTHRKRILKKVGARNPSQLVSWAVRNDLNSGVK